MVSSATSRNIDSTENKDQDVLDGPSFLKLVNQDIELAFTKLVTLYRQEIFDLCVRISGSRTEAEDLAQETFVKAYEKIESFRGDSAPRTWLYRIAINNSISFKRKLKRWRMFRGNDEELFPDLPELSVLSDETMIVNKDLAIHAHKALETLPKRQKTAVILRIIKEMPYEEVANVMGLSVGGAKANVHQGIKKLREML